MEEVFLSIDSKIAPPQLLFSLILNTDTISSFQQSSGQVLGTTSNFSNCLPCYQYFLQVKQRNPTGILSCAKYV